MSISFTCICSVYQTLSNIINYNTEVDFASNENISRDLVQSLIGEEGERGSGIYILTETLLLEAGLWRELDKGAIGK